MASYLVQLDLEKPGRTLIGGSDAMIVEAASSADAIAMAKGHYGGDSSAMWAGATATLLAFASDYADSKWSLVVQILDSSPVLDLKAQGGVLGMAGATVNAGGTGYAVNDLVTISGGTSSRVAKYRVTAETAGVVDTVELVDPGEYSVAPGLTGAATVGGNNDLTLDLSTSSHAYANYLAEMVGLCNATSIIANASMDMGAATPILTIAAIADGLGDKQVVAEMRYGDDAVPGLVGAIVDEGISAAVLTMEVGATVTAPQVIKTLKST